MKRGQGWPIFLKEVNAQNLQEGPKNWRQTDEDEIGGNVFLPERGCLCRHDSLAGGRL